MAKKLFTCFRDKRTLARGEEGALDRRLGKFLGLDGGVPRFGDRSVLCGDFCLGDNGGEDLGEQGGEAGNEPIAESIDVASCVTSG